jgi:hypothetical protein
MLQAKGITLPTACLSKPSKTRTSYAPCWKPVECEADNSLTITETANKRNRLEKGTSLE